MSREGCVRGEQVRSCWVSRTAMCLGGNRDFWPLSDSEYLKASGEHSKERVGPSEFYTSFSVNGVKPENRTFSPQS